MADKAFKLLILLIVCVNSIWSLDVCENQLNGAQLLHPLDCSKYIVCRFGMTYRIETCDGGRHFNRLTAECVDPFEAACDIDLIKEQFVLSNECDTCRAICGCSPEAECSTPSSSTPDITSPNSSAITPGENPTTSANPITPGLETSSSTTQSPDSSSSSTSSSATTDQNLSTPATSSETTIVSHTSSDSTETTSQISSETTGSSITSPVATETTPNTSPSNAPITPGSDTSTEVTVTTSPAEHSSPTPHIPSPSTTDAVATSPNTPNPDISSSISPSSTTATSSSVSSTSETTLIPPNPETPTSVTPSTSACTNDLKICVGKPNFSIIYVPGSCREYAVCIEDCANVLSCPNNLLYDLENHICTYPQNVKCSDEMTPPTGPSAGPSGTKCESHGKCENQPDGTLFADDSTGGYIVCQCECEVARPCPGGLVFNQESKVCDFPVIN
ncbi:hypothetical protein DOY81_008179 [Sarcophaga bullata]|nr:hypothetical protein DOY81_008179 [Sarcophaga bullata]